VTGVQTCALPIYIFVAGIVLTLVVFITIHLLLDRFSRRKPENAPARLRVD
jgi:hypothetical protein